MSAPTTLEPDPLAVLEEVSKRLEIDELDHLDLSLIDQFSFKSGSPKKWPSWTDLDITSCKPGNPKNRGEVVKAIHDLCSTLERLEPLDHQRSKISSVRKKLALLEDALSQPNPLPLLSSLEEVDKRLKRLDPNSPDVGILDTFAFHPGKPGLFAAWTDLDMSITATTPSNRGAVITAIRDLISKTDLMLNRPACQRTLGSATIEKYRAMAIDISGKLALLADTLSPPNPQPLLSMLEEVNRRFENIGSENLDLGILDSFAFRPGKPGLFIAWTDLDVTAGRTGSPDNRGAVIMAVHDLMAKFDRMLDRPACQKALSMEAIQKYRSIRVCVGEKLDLLKNAITPTNPSTPQAPSSPLSHQSSQERELIDVVKRKIGDQTPIWYPKLFSRAAWIEAGAAAGSSMMVFILMSIAFHPLARAIPIVGLMAIVVSFVRRHRQVTATAKQCAVAEDLYKNAATNNDILNIFPLLTRHAQAQFLVRLDLEFRENIAKRHARLKNMCQHIDSFLSSRPESPERMNALTEFPKEGIGEEVVNALKEKAS